MRRAGFLLTGLVAAQCGAPTQPRTQSGDLMPIVEIKEPTVGRLNQASVGVANVRRRPYDLPNGAQSEGLTAQVFVDDEPPRIVGAGSFIKARGQDWCVVEVTKPLFGRGRIHLRPVVK